MPAKGFSIMRGAAEKMRGMWYVTERIILLVKRLGVRRVAELSSEDISSENISSEYISYLLRGKSFQRRYPQRLKPVFHPREETV